MFQCMIVPDTQIIAKRHPEIYKQMTKSIVEFHQQTPLDAVIQLGDIVDDGALDIQQFEIAKSCWDIVENAGIPVILAAGNHDYDLPIGVGLQHPNPIEEGRKLTTFNDFFGGNELYHKAWYRGSFAEGQAENSYYFIKDILIIVLEFGPRDEILEWANTLLQTYAHHPCIVITHCYMYHDGCRTTTHSEHNPLHSKETADGNDGEMIWNKLLKHHNNVIAVFSGHHVPKNVCVRTDASPKGNLIIQSFQNWQEEENGGSGRMRFVQYDEELNQVLSKVYNPVIKAFEQKDKYTFRYTL